MDSDFVVTTSGCDKVVDIRLGIDNAGDTGTGVETVDGVGGGIGRLEYSMAALCITARIMIGKASDLNTIQPT